MTLNDLERRIHLKVRLVDGTLDVRMFNVVAFRPDNEQAQIERRYFQYEQFQDGGDFEKLQKFNGHNSATRHPIHFVFDSRVGFLPTADRMALFQVRSNPRWRPVAILKISNIHISATQID